MDPLPPRRPRYTPVRRWQPLTGDEWDALLPFVVARDRPGRPLRDARLRMDAIFWAASAACPWRELPARFGKGDTVRRHFRRLSDAGFWERLLRALSRPDCPAALLAIEHWGCAACRRVGCRKDLRIITLARRLGVLSALRARPWMLPDTNLSEKVHRWIKATLEEAFEHRPARIPPGFLRNACRWLTLSGGRTRIPRAVLPH